MAEKPRLLWHSNAPWASTGYGAQTALFTPRLNEHYKLTISAFYGLEGSIIPWNSIPVLPGEAGTYGNECIGGHVNTVFGDPREGLVVTLMDVWVLDTAIWRQFNTCCWVPVDHEPTPRPVRRFFEESGAVPIAMSKFGAEQLADLDPLYVPHGVDTEAYKSLPQKEAREATAIPQDRFVVGMVAANKGNPSRKCFVEAFQAFKLLKDKHEDALLYVHSEASGKFGGVDLPRLVLDCGLKPEDILFCDQYRAVHFPFDAKTMAQIYSSMDVCLLASAGEGFGIPAIEAQACGVPVIVSDFSAQPELVGAGWKVSGHKTYTPIGSWQFVPDIEDIADALLRAYGLTDAQRKQHAEKAREKALEYDADRVMEEHMLPALEEAQDRYAARKPRELAAA